MKKTNNNQPNVFVISLSIIYKIYKQINGVRYFFFYQNTTLCWRCLSVILLGGV